MSRTVRTNRTAYVLIVGAPPTVVEELKAVLTSGGDVHVTFADNVKEAFVGTRKYSPDFVVLDLSSEIIPGFKPVNVPPGFQSTSAFSIAMFQRDQPRGAGRPKLAISSDSLRNQLFRVYDQINRRRLLASDLERYSDDCIRADFVRGEFEVNGRQLVLAAREQEVLRFLIERPGEVVTRAQLHQHVWGYETRSLDVHIRRLRAKLGDAAGQIDGVKGFGYRFIPAGNPKT